MVGQCSQEVAERKDIMYGVETDPKPTSLD